MLKLLKKKKDMLLSKGIEKFIATYLERKKLGKITKCKLDSKKKNIKLTLLLKKEKEPLEIKISNYSFKKEGLEGYFTFDSISTSRDWNSNALERIIANKNKRIKVPKKHVKIISMFI